ncbi:hypothetical protein MmiHf6_08200 [Methanimicrococcus hongohii]|uniref:Uncharacterized protein n=1 Tax=Methanimicrococcus hongohii TaxID=3028295 RepID=A0AA96ZU72_9EURY|nr:hypothetical protein [Methanimicrococcus sp. Hf6]WNY23512.1 hypothetical protein MmiHf6_08200 [Methanimicrococcus sp. Hf6]
MATSSYTTRLIVRNPKSIKILEELLAAEGNSRFKKDDSGVDVFEEMRRCHELL